MSYPHRTVLATFPCATGDVRVCMLEDDIMEVAFWAPDPKRRILLSAGNLPELRAAIDAAIQMTAHAPSVGNAR